MASIRREIVTKQNSAAVWDAVRDIGALHTRLVPGFVVDTRLEPGVRIVTFGNGMIVREPIVAVDDHERRLVWTAVSDMLTHYNGAVQVFTHAGNQSRVVWTADFLPDAAAGQVQTMIEQGMEIMRQTLDRAAG